MNVLYALDSLNRGGTETRILDVCRNAASYGVNMTFVSFGGGSYEAEFQTGGFESMRIRRRFPIDPFLVRKLRRLYKERDIEIAHGFQPVEAVHLYLAALGTNVKCVQTHEGFISGIKNRRAAKWISPRVNANIAVSNSLVQWIGDELGIDTKKTFHIVQNAVDESRLIPSPNSVRTELDIPEPSFLSGMVANFLPTPTKDQMTICKALPWVFSECKDAAFVFVGKVTEGAETYFEDCVAFCDQEGIGDRVFFTGARTDVPDILNAFDLFVYSSRAEGLPVAVIEAMLVKLPVIVSDIEPLLEVTDGGNCASVFKTGDSDELAEQMIKLVKDREEAGSLARQGQEFAHRSFGIEAHFRRLKALYGEILDRPA